MGFKDVTWAYTIKLSSAQKAVLVAYAHKTDDKTHRTYVKQFDVGVMTGLSRATVNLRVNELARMGILTRQKRYDGSGQRTTDIVELVTTYVQDTNVGETNVGDTYVGETADLCPDDVPPTSGSQTAKGVNQSYQPVNQPEGPRKRGTRLSEDFTVTDGMRAWATTAAPLVDVDQATAMFVNHFLAKTGRDATKHDWSLTWKNWLLRDQRSTSGNPRAAANAAPTPRPLRADEMTGCANHKYDADGYCLLCGAHSERKAS